MSSSNSFLIVLSREEEDIINFLLTCTVGVVSGGSFEFPSLINRQNWDSLVSLSPLPPSHAQFNCNDDDGWEAETKNKRNYFLPAGVHIHHLMIMTMGPARQAEPPTKRSHLLLWPLCQHFVAFMALKRRGRYITPWRVVGGRSLCSRPKSFPKRFNGPRESFSD